MKWNKVMLAALALSVFGLGNAENLPTKSKIQIESDNLYETFQNPGSEYRPFVRWWWNGLRVDGKEILRELDLMKSVGIGGVEINSIGFPGEADSLGYKIKPYLSDEWADMVRLAADGCRERGMICDMIAGSGWPFGGEFLPREQQLQMLTVETVKIDGGTSGKSFSIGKDELLGRVNPPIMSKNDNPLKELVYIRLMPAKVDQFTEGVNYDNLAREETITFDVPAGKYVAYFFVKMTGYMNVIEGAPGACGPVLNHFDKDAVQAYIDRLSDKLQFTGPQMKGKVRATFVDSFELEGANWSDELLQEWEEYYGYSLLPYLPYVIRKVGHMGNPLPEDYGSEFSEEINKDVVQRLRNDFERFQIKLFQENFIDTYNKWCHENGVQSRIQAYGRALHPLESAMYIDIPECETWFRDGLGVDFPDNNIYRGRSHSMVNKFVQSGSLLAGNGRVSCEEITNTGEIFQSTLEEIKIAGDMSNISGVNHSILHGFNYSPKEAPFPGWIKFGEYFSEKNTMWPYYKYWMDYKARVSAVLQNSIPQADIAILPPLEDMWSVLGQQRDPFPENVYPAYAHDLWQNLHQNGNGCDYVSEHIIQQAKVKGGELRFGPRAYKTLMLMEVESLEPETASALEKFVANGGRIVCIGKVPYQSVGFNDYEAKSAEVKRIITAIQTNYPERFVRIDAPSGDNQTAWFQRVQQDLHLTPYVKVDRPTKWMFYNYYKSGKRDIFFITNFSSLENQQVKAEFAPELMKKQAWVWIPETGERYLLLKEGNTLNLHFNPAETKFIVFDTDKDGEMYPYVWKEEPKEATAVNGLWKVKATHWDGSVKEFEMEHLQDFNTLPFPWFRNFAGTVEYTIDLNVENPDAYSVLNVGKARGVTELYLNGEKIGLNWYGEHKYAIGGKLKKGDNTLTVKVVTPLGNYANSLVNNRTAKRYAHSMRALGLEGPVRMY